MKILHVIDSGGLYGAEIMLLNLVEEQISLGLKPVIASISDKKTIDNPIEIEAIKRNLHIIKFRMTPGPNILGALKILRYILKEHFDLIHSHGYKGNILLGFIPGFFRRVPMVSTLHGYTSSNFFSKMNIYEWIDSLTYFLIDSVVIVNKGMLNHPKIKKNKMIKFHIICNGISLEKINRKNFIKTKEFMIGSIGRLSSEKGFIWLIKAFEIFLNKGVDAKLVLIGDGYERKNLEQYILQNKLKDHVEFTGYMYNAKEYLNFFDVYAISSLTEGLPITLLEAMQFRVPVVATAVGGIPNVIDDKIDGLLVEPCDPNSMADSFYTLYKDPFLSKKLANNAYDKLSKFYSSRKMAKKYLDLYCTVLEKFQNNSIFKR